MIFHHHHDTGSRMHGLLPLQWTVLRAGMNWQSLLYTIWKWTLVSVSWCWDVCTMYLVLYVCAGVCVVGLVMCLVVYTRLRLTNTFLCSYSRVPAD